MSFLKKELFDTLVACEEFSEIANATDAQVKPLVFMSMDGGDQMKQLRINRSWPLCQYTLYDMEAIFIFVHASGSSEYNIIERQMASVPQLTAAVILLFGTFGFHLNSQNQTVDEDFEKRNFQTDRKIVADVWNNALIDGHLVTTYYIYPPEQSRQQIVMKNLKSG